MKWTATALAAAALLGCGGEEDAATGAGGSTPVVQVTAIAAGLKVTASATGAQAPDQTVRESTQFSFSASLSSGTHAGQSLAGPLILKGADANGVTEIEGVLLPAAGTAALNAAALARAAALQEELKAAVLALRTTLRADIESMSGVLREAMVAGAGSNASPTAAQSQALVQFKDAFTAVNAKYRSDVAALNAQALAKVGALGTTQKDGSDDDDDDDDDDEGGDDDEGSGGGGATPLPGGDIAVAGTIDAQGRVDLRLTLSDQTVISAVGQVTADGSLSGTLSGPDSTDQGTWTAGAVAMPAPPAPTPAPPPPASPPPPAAPVGDATAGLAKYTDFCASCHTANVRRNVLNVTGASTLNGLNAANSSVGVMRFLGTAMSAQDKLDVVAYINSAK